MSRTTFIFTVSLVVVNLVAAGLLFSRDGFAQFGSGVASVAVTSDAGGKTAWVATSNGVTFCRVNAPLADRPDVKCFAAQ